MEEFSGQGILGGGGGGGGYTGGDGSKGGRNTCGGGGGSFNGGLNQHNECCSESTGHGEVTITFLMD